MNATVGLHHTTSTLRDGTIMSVPPAMRIGYQRTQTMATIQVMVIYRFISFEEVVVNDNFDADAWVKKAYSTSRCTCEKELEELRVKVETQKNIMFAMILCLKHAIEIELGYNPDGTGLSTSYENIIKLAEKEIEEKP